MSVVFLSYSHVDERFKAELDLQLTMLKRQGIVSVWHDRKLLAGDDFNAEITRELEQADIILLLVSPNFLASEYCYGIEMNRALERQSHGTARVIPVILRPCEWQHAPFGHLLAAPRDGAPVSKFLHHDDAYLQIATAIREAATPRRTAPPAPAKAPAIQHKTGPRSSNLQVQKTFTERDCDVFLDESFEFMASFFENSLKELSNRDNGLETTFKRVDANQFTAAVYQHGKSKARCRIQLGGMFGAGISFSYAEHSIDNSINESLSIETGGASLELRPLGMPSKRVGSKLNQEEAAEYYWGLLIDRLRR